MAKTAAATHRLLSDITLASSAVYPTAMAVRLCLCLCDLLGLLGSLSNGDVCLCDLLGLLGPGEGGVSSDTFDVEILESLQVEQSILTPPRCHM